LSWILEHYVWKCKNGLKLRRTAKLLVYVDGVNLLGKNMHTM